MSTLTFLAVGLTFAAPLPKDLPKTSAFAGRFGDEKEKRLKQFGGDAKTEAAAEAGLKWLAEAQKKDGSWEFDGTQKAESSAATGLAVMAFLGAGYTAKADAKNPHAKVVAAGVQALLKMQKPDGSFQTAGTMYAHAIATVALCEAAGMGHAAAKVPAQAALNYIFTGQGQNGSWGYRAKTNGDTCITGWQAQAIRAGKAAGLKVDDKVLGRASKFLDTTMSAESAAFGYIDAKSGTPTLTCVGIAARVVFDDWTGETPALGRGAGFVAKKGSNPAALDTYQLFYASASLPLAGEDVWTAWNEKAVAQLLKLQVAAGKNDAGSWEKDAAYIGNCCGKVGTTAMAVLTLENYYRYPFPLKAK